MPQTVLVASSWARTQAARVAKNAATGQSVGSHAGQNDGQNAAAIDSGHGSRNRHIDRRAGSGFPGGPWVRWSMGGCRIGVPAGARQVGSGQPPPGASCRARWRLCPRSPGRLPLPRAPSDGSRDSAARRAEPVNSSGMCCTTRTGSGKPAGSAGSTHVERRRTAGGDADGHTPRASQGPARRRQRRGHRPTPGLQIGPVRAFGREVSALILGIRSCARVRRADSRSDCPAGLVT